LGTLHPEKTFHALTCVETSAFMRVFGAKTRQNKNFKGEKNEKKQKNHRISP